MPDFIPTTLGTVELEHSKGQAMDYSQPLTLVSS